MLLTEQINRFGDYVLNLVILSTATKRGSMNLKTANNKENLKITFYRVCSFIIKGFRIIETPISQ